MPFSNAYYLVGGAGLVIWRCESSPRRGGSVGSVGGLRSISGSRAAVRRYRSKGIDWPAGVKWDCACPLTCGSNSSGTGRRDDSHRELQDEASV